MAQAEVVKSGVRSCQFKKPSYQQFRPGREEIIDTVLSGRDCLVVMPLVAEILRYQIPCFIAKRPYRSCFTADFVDERSGINCKANGVAQQLQPRKPASSNLKLSDRLSHRANPPALYRAPERLMLDNFQDPQVLKPVLLAVDEAHCIPIGATISARNMPRSVSRASGSRRCRLWR